MILKLQIALTILACVFVAAVIPVAAWTSLLWGIVLALCAVLCYGGVLLCKQKTQTEEDEEADEEADEQAEQEAAEAPIEETESSEEDLENQEK